MARPKKKDRLKPAEELFCKLYAGDSRCFNNAVVSYSVAYNYDITGPARGKVWSDERKAKRYNVASVSASNLLRKPKILKRCEEVLLLAFKDQLADRELAKVMIQDWDLKSKLNAIEHYNKLKGRIIERLAFIGEVRPKLSPKRKKMLDKIFKKNK